MGRKTCPVWGCHYVSPHTVEQQDDYHIMRCNWHIKTRYRSNLRYYPDTCLGGLRTIKKNITVVALRAWTQDVPSTSQNCWILCGEINSVWVIILKKNNLCYILCLKIRVIYSYKRKLETEICPTTLSGAYRHEGFQSRVRLVHWTCDGGLKQRRGFKVSFLGTGKTNLRECCGVVFKLTLCLYCQLWQLLHSMGDVCSTYGLFRTCTHWCEADTVRVLLCRSQLTSHRISDVNYANARVLF
jgi:hypothetical protein